MMALQAVNRTSLAARDLAALADTPEETITYLVSGAPATPTARYFEEGICTALAQEGHRPHGDAESAPRLVIHFPQPGHLRPYRRRAQATFVATFLEVSEEEARSVQTLYPLLVRTLSNLLIAVLPRPDGFETHLVTPEQGHFVVSAHPEPGEHFRRIAERLTPIARSHLIIDNLFDPDLPEALWQGTPHTEALAEAGRRLGALDLLPAPFPLEEILPSRDLRHL
ncbi:MAG TPA: class II aldolase/adducin family protein, partial [Limnochordia bacterium]